MGMRLPRQARAPIAEIGFAPHSRMRRPLSPNRGGGRNGRPGRVGIRVLSERALTPRDNARSLPLEHSPCGARRYAGSHATLASLFRSKVCYYAPFAMTPLDGTTRRRITRRLSRWRWLRSLRPPARSWAGARRFTTARPPSASLSAASFCGNKRPPVTAMAHTPASWTARTRADRRAARTSPRRLIAIRRPVQACLPS
jgi:hypothetical protein